MLLEKLKSLIDLFLNKKNLILAFKNNADHRRVSSSMAGQYIKIKTQRTITRRTFLFVSSARTAERFFQAY